MVAAVLLAAPLHAQRADTLLIRTHTRILAADSLGGRDTGSPGERMAAAYITRQLARLGLEPLGDSGFTAPVPIDRVSIDTARTLLWVTGESTVFRHGADFVFGAGADEFRDFSGKLIFASRIRDGLEFVPVDGRVLVLDAPLGADAERALTTLGRAGLTGAIVPVGDSVTFARIAESLGEARYSLRRRDRAWSPKLTPTVVYAGQRLTAALIAERQSDDVQIAVTTHGARTSVDARNIVALLPGADSTRSEMAAISAHYDHLGTVRGAGADADSIYNGFSDNAAGVAMLLALADTLARDPPPHPTLFLFFTGEERGLMGSSWFAAHPALPLDRIRVLVNLDAGAPPAPPVSWRIATNDTALAAAASSALDARGWAVEQSRARANSDHWPLAQAGVPALFLVPGADWEGMDEAAESALRARWDRYHQPADEWSADVPFTGLQRYAEAALAMVQRVMQR